VLSKIFGVMTEVVKDGQKVTLIQSGIPYAVIHVVRKWGKTREKEGTGYEASTVLWHEMSAKNTSPKYIGR